jgi:hypothetical protein
MKTSRFFFALLLASGCTGAMVKTPPPDENPPPPGIDAAQWKTVDALVKKLGSEQWTVRDAAQKEIEALPESALEAVKASVERRSSDPEIKVRGEKAIAVLTYKPSREADMKKLAELARKGFELAASDKTEDRTQLRDLEKDCDYLVTRLTGLDKSKDRGQFINEGLRLIKEAAQKYDPELLKNPALIERIKDLDKVNP